MAIGHNLSSMSEHQQVAVDPKDVRPADWEIIDALRDGRLNAPLLAKRTGYSAQYCRERLARLREDGIVTAVGSGIYELNPENVPESE